MGGSRWGLEIRRSSEEFGGVRRSAGDNSGEFGGVRRSSEECGGIIRGSSEEFGGVRRGSGRGPRNALGL